MTYLDHAATTPMLPEARAAMAAQQAEVGNPSSLHASGRRARKVVEESREHIARALGARPGQVVFTAGGTEADNLAVKGLYWARRGADPRRRRVVVSSVEHHAVLDSARWLAEGQGADLELLPVDRLGRVAPSTLRDLLSECGDEVALVSVMWANNEIGTVQPIAELADIAHAHGVVLHTDAVQALGSLPVDFAGSGVDAMSVSAHKIGGPVGVGALLLGRGIEPTPVHHGGGQERDVRSGTLDVAGIAGFAAACEVSVTTRAQRAAHLAQLRERFVAGVGQLSAGLPQRISVNGDPQPGPTHRLPGIVHLSFPGCEGDTLLMLLDAAGVECSTGSACSAGVPEPSHVLLATGADRRTALSSLRFSFGHTSTASDVDTTLAALGAVLDRARRAGALSLGATARGPAPVGE